MNKWWGKLLCWLGYHEEVDETVYSEHYPELQEFKVKVSCRRCGDWWII